MFVVCIIYLYLQIPVIIITFYQVDGHKSMIEKIAKLESDYHMMKKILHIRKVKIEELQKQLNDKH